VEDYQIDQFLLSLRQEVEEDYRRHEEMVKESALRSLAAKAEIMGAATRAVADILSVCEEHTPNLLPDLQGAIEEARRERNL
jgi:hypothetical protein